MGKADKTAEHTVAVKPVCEIGMPRTPDDVALIPVSARIRIKHWPQPFAIELEVRGRGGLAEELPELGISRRGTDTCKLELEQRKVCFVEVDRVDLGWLCGEVRQRVAPARRNRDDGRSQRQLQRCKIGYRVLPYLGIDQTAKPECEKPVPDGRFTLTPAVADRVRDKLRVHPSPESTI